jgi:hypothetical protein
MKYAWIAALLGSGAFADAPRVVYTKEFKGSSPAWVNITLERNGEAVYKESPNDDYPLKFKLREPQAEEIFQLVEKLDRLSRPLESNLKVAYMGMKTFRFEDGATRNEQKFNYSLDESAKALADWFERMIESEQQYIQLERTVKYDKLGVNDSLLRLQVYFDRKRLVGVEQYLPLLDRVVKNDSYLHMARERAAAIADSIRAQTPPKSE